MSVFKQIFKIVLGHEGGYQNLYNDRGNWTTGIVGKGVNKGTKFGITAMSYPHLDIRNLTVADAENIYRKDYWNKINGDKLNPALALVAFDTAVNSGVGRAIEFLNKTSDVTEFLNLRRKFLKSLKLYNTVISGNRNRKTYGEVWDERVDLLEQQASQLALTYPDGSQKGQEGASKDPAGVRVMLDTGQGFTELTGNYDTDKLDISVVGNKVYIRYYK